MKSKGWVVFAIVSAFVLGSVFSGFAQEKITWRMQSSWPKGIEAQYQADLFAKRVTEMSNGRLTVRQPTRPDPSSEAWRFLTPSNQGVIDASHSISSYWIGKRALGPSFCRYPAWEWTPSSTQSGTTRKNGMDLWKEMYAKYNFGFVGPCGLNTAEDFLWAHKPIQKLSDFKGLKIRTVGYWGEIVTKLGARVVTLPGGEVYGALEKKILDAAEFANPSADYVMGLHQVCKYVHVPGVHQPTTISELIVNKKSWEKLSPDLQTLVKEAAKATTFEAWGHCIMEDYKAIRKFQEHGTQFIKLSPQFIQELKKACRGTLRRKGQERPLLCQGLQITAGSHQRIWNLGKLYGP